VELVVPRWVDGGDVQPEATEDDREARNARTFAQKESGVALKLYPGVIARF
jgi:hypothetical protein